MAGGMLLLSMTATLIESDREKIVAMECNKCNEEKEEDSVSNNFDAIAFPLPPSYIQRLNSSLLSKRKAL